MMYARQFLLVIIKFTCLFLFGCQDVKSPQPENTNSNPFPTPITSPPKPSAELSKAASQYRQLALQYRSQQRYTEAIAALSKSVELDPQNLSGRVIFGWTLHLAGKPTEAIAALQKPLLSILTMFLL